MPLLTSCQVMHVPSCRLIKMPTVGQWCYMIKMEINGKVIWVLFFYKINLQTPLQYFDIFCNCFMRYFPMYKFKSYNPIYFEYFWIPFLPQDLLVAPWLPWWKQQPGPCHSSDPQFFPQRPKSESKVHQTNLCRSKQTQEHIWLHQPVLAHILFVRVWGPGCLEGLSTNLLA